MIVLDTNVISEPMRRAPDRAVVDWLNRQPEAGLFTSSVCVMELQFGVARLPAGRRKAALAEVLEFTLSRLVGPRILPFDAAAASEAARIAAAAEARGARIGQADSQIAATALIRGFAIATRDAAPFEQAGLAVIDPWETA